jgi:hypothetical protein
MTSSGTSRRSTTIRMVFRDIGVLLSISDNPGVRPMVAIATVLLSLQQGGIVSLAQQSCPVNAVNGQPSLTGGDWGLAALSL